MDAGWKLSSAPGANTEYNDGVITNIGGKGLSPMEGAIQCSTSVGKDNKGQPITIYHVAYVFQKTDETHWQVAQYNVIKHHVYSTAAVSRDTPTATSLTGRGFASTSRYTLLGFIYPPGGAVPKPSPPPAASPAFPSPQIIRYANNREEIFMRGNDGAIYHTWPTSAGWTNWESFGTPGVACVGNPILKMLHGLIYFFVRDANGNLWYRHQQVNAGWTDWIYVYGSLAGDPAINYSSGGLELFARTTDNSIVHSWQLNYSDTWSNWESFGNNGQIVGNPVVMQLSSSDTRLELFVRGRDGQIWHCWQTGWGWSDWASLGGAAASDPQLARNADGSRELFVVATNGALQHCWTTWQGWSGWEQLGANLGLMGNPTVGQRDNTVLVFARRASDSGLSYLQRNAQGWTPWIDMGWTWTSDVGVSDPGVPEPQVDPTLYSAFEVFGRGTNGEVYHNWMGIRTNIPWWTWTILAGNGGRF